MSDEHFIPRHGGYENLRSYQKAVIVFVGTCFFVKKWLPRFGDRTVDQMVQAARSGKQNIVEGSAASGTSKEMEIKLTGVARASMEELKEDYLDFLRTRQLPKWDKDHRFYKRFEELNRTPDADYETFKKAIESDDPEIAANAMLSLTTLTIYLLKQQMLSLEKAFLKEGGLRERMTRARLKVRDKGDKRDRGDQRD